MAQRKSLPRQPAPRRAASTRAAGRGPRRIVMLAFPDAQILDVTGPLEVFAIATRLLVEQQRRDPGYEITLVAASAGPVRMSSGLELVAQSSLRDLRGPIDTLFVPGGEGTQRAVADTATIEAIRRIDVRAKRTAGVCSGAFLLARAGLLDGRRATTHWRNCDDLARRFPRVRVEPDRIYVRDGRIATSAGVTAGMDLALALVEDDLGGEIARDVARILVLFLRRPGGQSQFSVQLANPVANRPSLRELQAWIHEHPEADLGVEALARRMGMSPRNFARIFTRELAVTPARYVERARIEAARQWLEDSRAGLEEVAAACGFGSAETLRRAFQRALRVSPSAYRDAFARAETQREARA